MPMSAYLRTLREKVGSELVLVPSVSILLRDPQSRILLLKDADSGDRTTPGGVVEPYETPSEAAVREMWEETGFYVALLPLISASGPLPPGTNRGGEPACACR